MTRPRVRKMISVPKHPKANPWRTTYHVSGLADGRSFDMSLGPIDARAAAIGQLPPIDLDNRRRFHIIPTPQGDLYMREDLW